MTQTFPSFNTNETTSKNRQRRKKAQHNSPPSFTTTAEVLAWAQQHTGTHYFPGLEPSDEPKPTLEGLLKSHRDTVDQLSVRFPAYGDDLTKVKAEPVRWLWQNRIPLAGITLLDGDHGTGKSLLALQIAACVSSGKPMPDGTPTIQGGVVIISPNTDAITNQLQILTALGADLSRIKILSFIQQAAPEFHTGGYRPFTLPEDYLDLYEAILHVDARLIIFDPFMTILSREQRLTNDRLCHLLTDFNQRLIERNIACLLIRNCGAKGSHARPSVLERSDHFLTFATSRLLLSRDPFQPHRILLSHAQSCHSALTPTLTLQILPNPQNSTLPHIAFQGSHCLAASDFLDHRPDILHRHLLSQHLLRILAATTEPIPVAALYARSPYSSPFQIQRSLKDLLNMGQIQRSARGLYSLVTLTFSLAEAAATTPDPSPPNQLAEPAATIPDPLPPNQPAEAAATPPTPRSNPPHGPECSCIYCVYNAVMSLKH